MAKPGTASLSLALMAGLWIMVATAQPSSNCMNVIISMAPCLDYIMGNSTTPTTGCCTQLASVVHSDPKCLCQVINGGSEVADLGITVNRTVALQLPAACNVHTPSVSRFGVETSSYIRRQLNKGGDCCVLCSASVCRGSLGYGFGWCHVKIKASWIQLVSV